MPNSSGRGSNLTAEDRAKGGRNSHQGQSSSTRSGGGNSSSNSGQSEESSSQNS